MMNRFVEERLEDFLDGRLHGKALREFEAMLAADPSLQSLVDAMREQGATLRLLRPEEEITASPGFYARVMDCIDSQKPTLWSSFLDPVFGRRLVYAALTLVVLMGTYIAATEPVQPETVAHSPEVILSSEPEDAGSAVFASADAVDKNRDREAVLVQMVSVSE